MQSHSQTHPEVEPDQCDYRTLKTSHSIYGVKIIKVYPAQQGLWDAQKAPNLFLITGFYSVLPFVRKGLCEKLLSEMLFLRSRWGPFGSDLAFIVGLSFVETLMPLCPLPRKSPHRFFLLLFERQGSSVPRTEPQNKQNHQISHVSFMSFQR